MPSFVTANRAALRRRHYVRDATAANRWFDFASSKVQQFERRYGDDFCLVVNGSEDADDAYVLPYRFARQVFKAEHLDSRGRWVGTIVGDHLKLGKADRSHPVHEFHNAFHLLR